MDEHKVRSRYRVVYDSFRELEHKLFRENDWKGGFFSHILNGLFILSVPSEFEWYMSKNRDLFFDSVSYLRTYRKLLNKHPDFKKGELGTLTGRYNSLEGRTKTGRGNKRAIIDPRKYIEYAFEKLEGRKLR